MKKIIVFALILVVAVVFLSVISFSDFEKDDSLEVSYEFEPYTFYYQLGDTLIANTDLTYVPVGTRGFFLDNKNNLYFGYYTTGHESQAVNLDPEALTYGDFTYCYYLTRDMKTMDNYSDSFSATFDGNALIIYLSFKDGKYDDIVGLNELLTKNQPLQVQYYDPPESEGPSAE